MYNNNEYFVFLSFFFLLNISSINRCFHLFNILHFLFLSAGLIFQSSINLTKGQKEFTGKGLKNKKALDRSMALCLRG